ncbi:MAG: T9SS type A sorting domain-containing protein [bacterium]
MTMRSFCALLCVSFPVAVAAEWESRGPDGGIVDGFAQSAGNPDRMYLLLRGAGLLRSDDHGVSWSAPSPGLAAGVAYEAVAVGGSAPEVVLVAPATGTDVHRSTDLGATWTTISVGGDVIHLAFDPFDASTVLACVANPGGGLHRSTDGGLTWAATSPELGIPSDVAWHPDTPGWLLAGAWPDVFRSTDDGSTWTAADLGAESAGLYVAWGATSASEAWTFATGGLALRSTDGGATFLPAGRLPGCSQNPGGWTCWRCIVRGDENAPGHVTAAYSVLQSFQPLASGSQASTSTDGGLTWSAPWAVRSSNGDLQPTTLAEDFSAPGVRYVSVGDNPSAIGRVGLARSTDGGLTWDTWMNGIRRLELLDVDHDAQGNVYVRDETQQGRWRSSDGGDTWEFHGGSLGPFSIRDYFASRHTAGLLYEAGVNYTSDTGDPQLRRSTDGGDTWQDGFVDVLPENGWSGDPVLIAADPSDTTVFLWIDGSLPYLCRGMPVPNLPLFFATVHTGFLAADAYVETASTLWAIRGEVPGDVQQSTDGGVTWTVRSSGLPSNIGVALFARPGSGGSSSASEFFAVYRTAGTYRTTDAGLSWSPVALPGYSGETLVAADRDAAGERLILATANSVYVEGIGFVADGLPAASPIREVTYDSVSGAIFVATDGASAYRLLPGSAVWTPVAPAASSSLSLSAAPNPTRAGVTLRFTVPSTANTRVEIFDVAGRRVETLVDGVRAAGSHEIVWEGASAPGVYFARVVQGERSEAQRIVRIAR